MRKILHITNWYPNRWDNLEGVFIKKQFDLFSEVSNSNLVNVQIRKGDKLFEYKHVRYSDTEEGYYILTKINSSKIIEFFNTVLLLYVLYRKKYKRYDLLHFHIAYPLLIHYYLWKKIVQIPITVSEHWSAYHYNFFMPKETKKLDNIKRIFKQKIPLITVSKALLNDIREFSGCKDFKFCIIPNVINQNIFYLKNIPNNELPAFFIVNEWSDIKNPFPMLEAFSKLSFPYILKIGGYGDLFPKMKEFVKFNNMEEKVVFYGKMSSEEIAKELNSCDAYLFSSKYETFSIICAEALSCGCPLIGPALPAISEYANKDNSLLFQDNCVESWVKVLEYFSKNRTVFDRVKIAKEAKKIFSFQSIKNRYLNFINKEILYDK